MTRVAAARPADCDRREEWWGSVGMLYAIGCQGRVKIGFAREPRRRLPLLQTGSLFPLRLLGYMPGTREDEFNVHRECAEQGVAGEWFEIEGPARTFVELAEDYMTEYELMLRETNA